jgi:putative SOS response-associated peptidase YedK
MCGRYVITKVNTKTKTIITNNEGVEDIDQFNAHPSALLPIIKKDEDALTLSNFHWGLFPKWAEKIKDFRPLINARVETLAEKITFKSIIAKQRLVVPADGYYEWRKDENNKKTPCYFLKEDQSMMFFAGVYQKNSNTEFAIITTKAEKNIEMVHERMPVILEENKIMEYLTSKDPLKFLENHKSPHLNFHEVSREVNKPSNNYPELINKV